MKTSIKLSSNVIDNPNRKGIFISISTVGCQMKIAVEYVCVSESARLFPFV